MVPVLEDYVFGADFSRHSGEIDWDKLVKEGIKWAGLRASVCDYYIDPTFRYNYDNSVRVGIIPLPYYVVRFDDKYSSDAQADKYLEALHGRKTWVDIPDVELIGSGVNKSDRGRKLHYTMQRVEVHTHAMQTIYTSEGFWEAYMPAGFLEDFNDRPLFAASYGADMPEPYIPPHPRFPSVPDIWESEYHKALWTAWQFSQRWRFDGVPSSSDAGWMKAGFYTALRKRSGIPEPVLDPVILPPPDDDDDPPPTGDFEARLLSVEELLEEMHGAWHTG